QEINFLYPQNNKVAISLNETVNLEDLNNIVDVFAQAAGKSTIKIEQITQETTILKENQRQSSFMDNEVFNSYHSETELMRYIKKLERKDLALNHSMISLGSCTMKLNAASEMLPISWEEWGNIHPFV